MLVWKRTDIATRVFVFFVMFLSVLAPVGFLVLICGDIVRSIFGVVALACAYHTMFLSFSNLGEIRLKRMYLPTSLAGHPGCAVLNEAANSIAASNPVTEVSA